MTWAHIKDEARRNPRLTAVTAAAVVLVAWLVVSSAWSSHRADKVIGLAQSQQLLIDRLATELDDARKQGAVVPTPEQVAAAVPGGAEVSPPVSIAPGIPGERGEAGSVGEVGATGATGEAGRPPTDAEIASAVALYCAGGACRGEGGPGGLQGPQGDPGIGVAGANGADGASVQGPPGPAGADGQPGADGAPGSPGADSQVPGPPGPRGPPPSSFTFAIGPVTYVCTPTADPSAFDCQPTP